MLKPRPYQIAATESAYAWLMNEPENGLVVAPVGSGKSLLIAELIKKIHANYPGARILMLTHVRELIEQNLAALLGQYPHANVGVYCAGLDRKELHHDITYASIQSIYNKALDIPRAVEIVIVDEVHLISRNDETTYRRFLKDLKSINPNMKVMGYTGTPFRQDSGHLDSGDEALFGGRAYEIGIDWMIKNGYLCKPIMPNIITSLNIDGVKSRGGDYIEKQLQEAVDKEEVTIACVDEIMQYGKDRKKWLVFTSGLTHCQHVYDEIRSRGISCEMITGKTPKDERDAILEKYKNGDVQCMVNVGVLTTGFNNPAIDLIAFMRPTKSKALYIQMAGRGLRTHAGKENCMFLDFGNVVKNLGPLDKIEIRKSYIASNSTDNSKIATKICPACSEVCAAAQKYCYKCSYEFPIKSALEMSADKRSLILSGPSKPEIFKVMGMVMQDWPGKDGKPNMLRVDYTTMAGQISEFVFFNHPPESYPHKKAVRWHYEMITKSNRSIDWGAAPLYPESSKDAISIPYNIPIYIECAQEGKYWRIINRFWDANSLPEAVDF